MDDYNKIDLQELYFQLYLENASDKEIIEINYLLEQNEYERIEKLGYLAHGTLVEEKKKKIDKEED